MKCEYKRNIGAFCEWVDYMNKLSVNTWSFLMKVKREKKIIMKIKLQIKFLLNLVEKENHLEKKRGERERRWKLPENEVLPSSILVPCSMRRKMLKLILLT